MSTTPPLPRLTPHHPILLTPEPLTPTTFSPFGTAITSPLPQHLTSVPSSLSIPLYPRHQPASVRANQNTALKTADISPLTNNYPVPSTRNGDSGNEGKGLMSIFSCFPRRNTYLDPKTGKLRLRLEVLERHPFTTQTFCPLNFSSSSSSSSSSCSSSSNPGNKVSGATEVVNRTYFLVIVAPTLVDSNATPPNPPDLTKVRAFLAPVTVDGGGVGVAVTYAPGTWHAPMVVVGDRRVDFLVTQFVNGVAGDDCQEVIVGDGDGDGKGKGKVVEVDLGGLGVGVGSEVESVGLWKARL